MIISTTADLQINNNKVIYCNYLILILTNIYMGYNIFILKQSLNSEFVESEINKSENIRKVKISFNFSTVGATLTGVYANKKQMEYLSVDSLGELGRKIEEFTFLNDYIIFNQIIIYYKQPYYNDPQNIKIQKVDRKQYIIDEKSMYELDFNDEKKYVSSEIESVTRENLNLYIKTLEE